MDSSYLVLASTKAICFIGKLIEQKLSISPNQNVFSGFP